MSDRQFDIFELDKNRLDEEWLNQPKLYFRYANDLMEARAALEEARAREKLVTAEVDQEIRSTPVSEGQKAPTEGSIKNACILDERVQKVVLSVLRKQKHVAELEVVVSALDHRKRALENLVHLHGQQYFSTPRGPKGMAREDVDNIVKKRKKERA